MTSTTHQDSAVATTLHDRVALRRSRTLAEPLMRDVFSPTCIDVVPDRHEPAAIFDRLLNLLIAADRFPADQGRDAVQALLDRERYTTTALGRGLALPYLNSHAVSQPVGAALIVPDGARFVALDAEASRVIFLVIFPLFPGNIHDHVMGRLARLLFDRRLNSLAHHEVTPDDVYRFLCDLDL